MTVSARIGRKLYRLVRIQARYAAFGASIDLYTRLVIGRIRGELECCLSADNCE